LPMMESIYNLIPQERELPSEQPRHESKYRSTVKAEVEASKSQGKLFGPKGGVKPSTKKFLKKGEGQTIRARANKTSERFDSSKQGQTILAPEHGGRVPQEIRNHVPRHNESGKFAPRTSRDYVKTNRHEATRVPVRKVTEAYVDKPAGTGGRFATETSGLKPVHSKSKSYGKVPTYLTKRKQDIQAEAQERARMHQVPTQSSSMRPMSEEERAAILAGLKTNWETLHREYQGLSMFTDTIPKKTKRNNMEAQLNQLEADINRFERHKIIYVDTR